MPMAMANQAKRIKKPAFVFLDLLNRMVIAAKQRNIIKIRINFCIYFFVDWMLKGFFHHIF